MNIGVALCLENGLVGQGESNDDVIVKLREAIESFEESRNQLDDVYSASVSIGELHEFLRIEGRNPH